MEIINICGKSGVGKDYLADHIYKYYGFKRWSYALHEKVWLASTGVISKHAIFGPKTLEERTILQTDLNNIKKGMLGYTIWTRVTEQWLNVLNHLYGFNKFVFTDSRFQVELDWVKSMGGYNIYIHAPDRENTSGLSEMQKHHISEREINVNSRYIDFVLDNSMYYENTSIDNLDIIMMTLGFVKE